MDQFFGKPADQHKDKELEAAKEEIQLSLLAQEINAQIVKMGLESIRACKEVMRMPLYPTVADDTERLAKENTSELFKKLDELAVTLVTKNMESIKLHELRLPMQIETETPALEAKTEEEEDPVTPRAKAPAKKVAPGAPKKKTTSKKTDSKLPAKKKIELSTSDASD